MAICEPGLVNVLPSALPHGARSTAGAGESGLLSDAEERLEEF